MNKLRLSELANIIQETLQQRFAAESFWVVADVSDHKYYPDRDTHYFDLVEKDNQSGRLIARMTAVSWAEGSKHIEAFQKSTGQKFTSGIQVLCKVQVEFHISYGMKLRLVDIDISFTLGELEKQKRETIERLLRECSDFIVRSGDEIITRNKGLQLKRVLQRIAIIGSKQSAGYGDFMHTLTANRFGYTFLVDTYHTQVQGEANAAVLVEQLIKVFQSQQTYDVVVIIRGGGAETDFLLFNDYHLCRAIAKFPIPIITGIGHLKDQSIADLMANTETNAPTKAAEFIIAHNRRFEEAILNVQKNMLIRVQQQLSNAKQSLNRVQSIVTNNTKDLLTHHNKTLVNYQQIITQKSMALLHNQHKELITISHKLTAEPKLIINSKKQELQTIKTNIASFQKILLKNQRGFLNHYISLINLASPEKTLKRGFAIIRKGGQIITSPEKLHVGDDVSIELKDSIIASEIKEIKDGRKNDI